MGSERSDVSQDKPGAPQAGDFGEANEPFALFEGWLREAEATEPNDPNAMALATVDPDGLPNVRMVLLKGLDPGGTADRGFVFSTPKSPNPIQPRQMRETFMPVEPNRAYSMIFSS